MAIVLDPNYGERIIELARECHVWLVSSASNYAAAQALWQSDPEVRCNENELLEPSAADIDELDLYEYHHFEPSKNGFVTRRAPA